VCVPPAHYPRRGCALAPQFNPTPTPLRRGVNLAYPLLPPPPVSLCPSLPVCVHVQPIPAEAEQDVAVLPLSPPSSVLAAAAAAAGAKALSALGKGKLAGGLTVTGSRAVQTAGGAKAACGTRGRRRAALLTSISVATATPLHRACDCARASQRQRQPEEEEDPPRDEDEEQGQEQEQEEQTDEEEEQEEEAAALPSLPLPSAVA
jgi:hypothetical protein